MGVKYFDQRKWGTAAMWEKMKYEGEVAKGIVCGLCTLTKRIKLWGLVCTKHKDGYPKT